MTVTCQGRIPETSWSENFLQQPFPTQMVRNSVQETCAWAKYIREKQYLSMDVVPERRTQRFSLRFWPGDRFCELSFRYLSLGSEEEKWRIIHRMWQTPFIHSAHFITRINLYIYIEPSSASWHGANLNKWNSVLFRTALLKFSYFRFCFDCLFFIVCLFVLGFAGLTPKQRFLIETSSSLLL